MQEKIDRTYRSVVIELFVNCIYILVFQMTITRNSGNKKGEIFVPNPSPPSSKNSDFRPHPSGIETHQHAAVPCLLPHNVAPFFRLVLQSESGDHILESERGRRTGVACHRGGKSGDKNRTSNFKADPLGLQMKASFQRASPINMRKARPRVFI